MPRDIAAFNKFGCSMLLAINVDRHIPSGAASDILCVIKAIALVAEEYQLDHANILRMPIDSSGPNLQQKRRRETAYLWLYESDGYPRALFEIERVV